jgi:hypothetical protein
VNHIEKQNFHIWQKYRSGEVPLPSLVQSFRKGAFSEYLFLHPQKSNVYHKSLSDALDLNNLHWINNVETSINKSTHEIINCQCSLFVKYLFM